MPPLAGARNLGLDDPRAVRPDSHCNFGDRSIRACPATAATQRRPALGRGSPIGPKLADLPLTLLGGAEARSDGSVVLVQRGFDAIGPLAVSASRHAKLGRQLARETAARYG